MIAQPLNIRADRVSMLLSESDILRTSLKHPVIGNTLMSEDCKMSPREVKVRLAKFSIKKHGRPSSGKSLKGGNFKRSKSCL